MADNWVGAKSYYSSAPTEATESASVHETKNQALIIEELADKYVIFIVKKTNPQEVLAEVERGFDSIARAKSRAQEWMEKHPQGLTNHP